MREAQVQFLGREDALEKGMAASPAFLPGESHGQRSLGGYSPLGHKELDMTERLTLSLTHCNQGFFHSNIKVVGEVLSLHPESVQTLQFHDLLCPVLRVSVLLSRPSHVRSVP